MQIIGYNYIAVFLTFSCNNKCPYCITRIDGLKKRGLVSVKEWVGLFNVMDIEGDVPITLQGGEPTLHPGFYEIMNGVDLKNKSFNLMTNLNFDLDEFIEKIPPTTFNRDAPFPSIRVSYHTGQIDRDLILKRVKILTDKGYNIGLYMLNHPQWKEEIEIVKSKSASIGIDFRLKEFLDRFIDPSKMKYHFNENQRVLCRNSDLIISPDMNIFKCHYDLYTNTEPVGNLLSTTFDILQPLWRKCTYPNKCNPCDIKIKNNRFQEWGHCSVEIKPYENFDYKNRI